MDIKRVSSTNVISSYNKISSNSKQKISKINSDKIEISSLGKELLKLASEELNIDRSERVNKIKEQINKGTYNIDSKYIAIKMLESTEGNDK
jgi:negative regulator of flagellin synthesis FlgM